MKHSKETMEAVRSEASKWLSSSYDKDTQAEVEQMLEDDSDDLVNSFYKSLEFGTGGLRGIIGAGTNRINRYTIGGATQALANYLKEFFKGKNKVTVAIAHDSRNMSPEFAQVTADVLSANGINALLFSSLRPTPLLSFAVRELSCQAGIVITASHNPKEYNGYKVYWEDGGQLVAPHDRNIINKYQELKNISKISFEPSTDKITVLGDEIDKKYIEKVKSISKHPQVIKNNSLRIVYTPLHGSGHKLVPDCLKAFGFSQIENVPEQDVIDGNFPTVKSPNPEDPDALKLALEKAIETSADLVLATDPDADRVGIAFKNKQNQMELLNGNQIASLIVDYILSNYSPTSDSLPPFISKTIVTTNLLESISKSYNIDCHEVLTGFKNIAADILVHEGKKEFLAGGEESFGYLVGDFVRDKDAIISCCIISEIAAFAKSKDLDLSDLLKELYLKHGFYLDKLVSLVKPGKTGEDEIKSLISSFRKNPPSEILGSKVVSFKDFQTSKAIINGKEETINLPSSNVLQFETESMDSVTVRPSGTEPKIKFYFSSFSKLKSLKEYDNTKSALEERLEDLKRLFAGESR